MHRRFDAIDEILCDNITSHTNCVYDDISQKTCILLYRKNNNDPLVLQIVLITYGSPFSSSVLEVSSFQPIKFHCVKSFQIRSFFLVRIQENIEETPYLDTFHTVFLILSCLWDLVDITCVLHTFVFF